jgi:hypothetical protein
MTPFAMLAIVGVTALSAVACSSSDNSSPSATSTSSVAPSKVNGEDEVIGSIDSVSGPTITVSGPKDTASVSFTPSTKIMELTPAKLTDIKAGQCVTIRPASGAEGGTVTADAVVVGASSSGQCQKTGGADNAGLPSSPLGGFRGTVDSVSEKALVLATVAADGSATKTTVQVNDTTLIADRHKVTGDAIVGGKCIIAGGTNDTGGTLQALTINLPLVVDGKCPQPK